jgi:hypothetical protein
MRRWMRWKSRLPEARESRLAYRTRNFLETGELWRERVSYTDGSGHAALSYYKKEYLMKPRTRRFLTGGTVAMLLAAATSAFAEEYRITLTDLTTGQPFSPPVFATHDASLTLWEPGAAASNGIQQIAETGDRMPLINDLTPLVGGSVRDLVTPLSSPLLPGGAVTIRIHCSHRPGCWGGLTTLFLVNTASICSRFWEPRPSTLSPTTREPKSIPNWRPILLLWAGVVVLPRMASSI